MVNIVKEIKFRAISYLLYKNPVSKKFYYLYKIRKDLLISNYFINSEKQIAYRIIPKAACTSIKESLISTEDNTLKGYDSNKDFFLHQKLSKYSLPYKFIENETFIFTYVRNPYDRLLSFYLNINNKNAAKEFNERIKWGPNSYLLRCKSFSSFVLHVFLTPKKFMDPHLIPQATILKSKFERINFIGKLEEISETYPRIEEQYNLKSLGHYNTNSIKDKNIDNFYNSFTKKLIYLKYKADFNKFNYSK